MLRCVKRDRFKTPFDLINHLRVCEQAQEGEIKCLACEKLHSFKKKGRAHQILKSPVTLLQRRWSVRKHADLGRSPGPALAPASRHGHSQEVDLAELSDSSSGTDLRPMPHSEQRHELQDPSYFHHVSEAAAESVKQPRTKAQFHGPVDRSVRFQNVSQRTFAPSFPHQPSMNQSWSENSERSTLIETSPTQAVQKQLSGDLMSIQSSNGSYHDTTYAHGGQKQVSLNTSTLWLPDSVFTGSPEGVEPSAQSQAPWQGQNNHEQPAISNAVHQMNMLSSQHMNASLNGPVSFASPAVETATNQLRRQFPVRMTSAPTWESSDFFLQAQRAQTTPLTFGNNSYDSYETNFTDEMMIDRPLDDQSVTTETVTGFPDNTSYHVPDPSTPVRRNAVKVTQPKHRRHRVAKTVPEAGNGIDLAATPLDELKCHHDGCDYRPTGIHKKNYRSHLERHLKQHDINAITPCPMPGCNKMFRGDRRDNLQEHMRNKHQGTVLERVEPRGGLSSALRRTTRRKIPRTPSRPPQHTETFLSGGMDTARSRIQMSRTVSRDDDPNLGGVVGTQSPDDATLMGISGDINGNRVTPAAQDGGQGLPPTTPQQQESEDILSQTGIGNMMGRQYVLPETPWNGEEQDASYGGGGCNHDYLRHFQM